MISTSSYRLDTRAFSPCRSDQSPDSSRRGYVKGNRNEAARQITHAFRTIGGVAANTKYLAYSAGRAKPKLTEACANEAGVQHVPKNEASRTCRDKSFEVLSPRWAPQGEKSRLPSFIDVRRTLLTFWTSSRSWWLSSPWPMQLSWRPAFWRQLSSQLSWLPASWRQLSSQLSWLPASSPRPSLRQPF
jgi:hypothetical protein